MADIWKPRVDPSLREPQKKAREFLHWCPYKDIWDVTNPRNVDLICTLCFCSQNNLSCLNAQFPTSPLKSIRHDRLRCFIYLVQPVTLPDHLLNKNIQQYGRQLSFGSLHEKKSFKPILQAFENFCQTREIARKTARRRAKY